MAKQSINQYQPDIVSPPGDTLEELLEERGMTQADLAERTGRSKKLINEIIQGKARITAETALQLELVLGVPVRFWLEREQQYRESLARRDEADSLASMIGWLKQVPVKDMVRLGWIQRYQEPIEQLREVLRFFSIASPNQWEGMVADYRKSPAFESDPLAISAWLRRGEIEAQQIRCAPFNEAAFRTVLTRIRALTIESAEYFQPKLVAWCAAVGVAVVFVPELPHTHVSGATRWLSPTRALIQLSLRYKTDDHLWFTFFHEAGHILLHGKRDLFLESNRATDEKEQEANHFAADFLIAPEDWQRFITTRDYRSIAAISAFAREIGIAPGIVVGRLQHHEKLIPPKNCNGLKRHFEWAQPEPTDIAEA
ncbi:MAG: helix-turn-helix domain-containing protein [Oscillochloris sp.]|nr:helix-turn-helix domain-containing protein [Oscillochloris sp.]